MASLEQLTVAIPNAGRRTLLAALSDLSEARFPDRLRVCVLDAERMDAPAQIALLDELAADPLLDVIFALNKADRITGPRTVITRTLALLRERGFRQPILYPVCARAALLFGLPTEQIAGDELMSELGSFYFRYSPGEQSLSAFAVTRDGSRCLGSREVTPEQLRLAVTNTGVPALAAALEAQCLPEPAPVEATGNRQQATGDAEPASDEESAPAETVGAAIGRPPEEPALDEEPAPVEEPAPIEEPAPTEEPAPIEAVGAAIGRPPEEPAPDEEPALVEEPSPDEEPDPDEVLTELLELTGLTDAPDEEEVDAAPEDGAPEAPSEEPAPDEPAPAAGLDELLAQAAGADCAKLLDLARAVPTVDASNELRDQAMDQLHAAYQRRQTEELDMLTEGADALGLEALRALADQISAGPYTVQARTPYAARINRRIDELQSDELAALCAGVEEADSRELAQIRERLEKTDCAEVLKTEHYQRIEARQEALDLEALDRVTAGAEQMNEKELRALAVTLEAGNWNQKFVTGYRHRIELLREAVIYNEVQDELAELDDMERREVLELRERIMQKALPARFTAGAEARIDEKLYRLDMLRLMALNNDLDKLDFDGLDELRAIVARGDYSERARQEYLDRLMAREKALILENASARAELTRQLIAQHKLRMSDFTISASSRDYEERLQAFWGGTGLEQPRDIPVFLFDNASDYAMSGSRFYYKTGRDLAYVPVENIDHFQVMRQHLSLNLQIVGKDSSYRLTDAKISRGGAERTLAFLNDCVSRWAEPGPPSSRGIPAELRLPRLNPADYTAAVEAEPPTAKDAWEQFCAAYEAAGLRQGNLVRPGDDADSEKLRRLRLNFGLPENAALVWYGSASRLGPVKEGAAVGPKAVYLKEGKQPLRSIPIEEVFELRAVSGKRVNVVSLRGESLTLEISDDMVPLLSDYVRTIQLGAWLRRAEAKA